MALKVKAHPRLREVHLHLLLLLQLQRQLPRALVPKQHYMLSVAAWDGLVLRTANLELANRTALTMPSVCLDKTCSLHSSSIVDAGLFQQSLCLYLLQIDFVPLTKSFRCCHECNRTLQKLIHITSSGMIIALLKRTVQRHLAID